jgi:MFS family permease
MRRRAPLVAFLTANAVSIAGTRISGLAIPWFVLTTTGSAAKTGLVFVCEMAPLVVMKALGGPLIDRVGPRRVSVVADTASMAIVGAIPVLHALGLLHFPTLLVIVALAGLFRGPGDTAKATLVPDVAELARVPIERVTGLESTADRGATMVAPALGGLLVAAVGPANAIVVDAVSFGICALLIAVWAPRHRHAAGTEEDEGGYLTRLAGGWRFLSRDPLILAICLMVLVTNLLDAAAASVLMPVWIHDHGYGPAVLGLLWSSFGVTATVGALLAAALGHRLPRRTVYLIGFTIAGAPRFVVMALGAPLWLIVAVFAAGGLGAGFLNPIIGAVFIERTPRAMLGRVGALADSLAWAGIPFGGLLAGAAVAGIGLAPALVVAGGAYFVATTVPGFLRQWKEMDSRNRPEPAAAPAGHEPLVAAGPARLPVDPAA